MEECRFREYVRKLEELVVDEERIVTYKLLSRTLGIHVNTAKQLLYIYLSQQQKLSPCVVSATYLIAGCKEDGHYFISITSEDKLSETYSMFDKVTSEHVYSVQKGDATGLMKNSQMLYAADSNLEPPKSYPIKLNNPIERKTREGPRKNKENVAESRVEHKSEEKDKEPNDKKSSPLTNGSATSRKANLISNFFGNQAERKKSKKTEGTCDGAGSTTKRERLDAYDSPNTEDGNVKQKSSTKETLGKEMAECESARELKKIRDGNKTKTAKAKKKRKRILTDSGDSDSDEEMRDAMLSANVEDAENVERRIVDEEAEDGDVLRSRRKRKKKTIDKTVLGEDGYVETIKEVVYETDSDSETPQIIEQEAMSSNEIAASRGSAHSKLLKNNKEKGSSNKSIPKKQSTLLSFFKKN